MWGWLQQALGGAAQYSGNSGGIIGALANQQPGQIPETDQQQQPINAPARSAYNVPIGRQKVTPMPSSAYAMLGQRMDLNQRYF